MKPSTSTLALRPATRLPKGVYVIPTAPASDRWARGATRGPRALIGGVADRRRGAMTVAVTRKELGAVELRREAGRCRDARAAGMDRQTLRDWVHRYNAVYGRSPLCKGFLGEA